MGIFDIFVIGVGLSMDAFAVAATDGIVSRPNIKKALLIAFAFGLFQAVMPLIGFFAVSRPIARAKFDLWGNIQSHSFQ